MERNQSFASEMTGTRNWLQLFAGGEGDSAPASEPTAPTNPLLADDPPAGEPAQEPTGQEPPAEGQTATPEQQTQPAQQPAQEPPKEPEFLDFAGRKVPVPADERAASALRALHKDMQKLQGALTKTKQELAMYKQGEQPPTQQANQTPTHQQAPQGQTTTQQQAQQFLAGLSPEERERLSEQFMEDPAGAIESVIDKLVKPLVENKFQEVQSRFKQQEEWITERQRREAWDTEIASMRSDAENYPDFESMWPVMVELSRVNNIWQQAERPIETLYRLARGYSSASQPAPQPTSVDAVLSDSNLKTELKQRLKEELREEIIRDYVEALRRGEKPVVISGTGGGTPPAVPPQQPKTLREATAMWLGSMKTE